MMAHPSNDGDFCPEFSITSGDILQALHSDDTVVWQLPFIDISKATSSYEFAPEKLVEILKLMEHRYGSKDFVTSKDDCRRKQLMIGGTFQIGTLEENVIMFLGLTFVVYSAYYISYMDFIYWSNS